MDCMQVETPGLTLPCLGMGFWNHRWVAGNHLSDVLIFPYFIMGCESQAKHFPLYNLLKHST